MNAAVKIKYEVIVRAQWVDWGGAVLLFCCLYISVFSSSRSAELAVATGAVKIWYLVGRRQSAGWMIYSPVLQFETLFFIIHILRPCATLWVMIDLPLALIFLYTCLAWYPLFYILFCIISPQSICDLWDRDLIGRVVICCLYKCSPVRDLLSLLLLLGAVKILYLVGRRQSACGMICCACSPVRDLIGRVTICCLYIRVSPFEISISVRWRELL